MSKQIDVLKLALEALDGLYMPNELERVNKAIIAINEALAQQSNEQVEPDIRVSIVKTTMDGKVGNVWWINENLPEGEYRLFVHPPVPTAQPKEPEQEPVAWITNNGDGWLRWHRAKDNNSNSIPLYTTPPQRKPLTDEQIDTAIRNSKKVDTGYAGWVRDQRREFARAIEAAHGIK